MKQSWGTRGALAAIGLYRRWVSPLTPPSCRFVPTCSHYTYDAIARFGLWRGGLLGAKRVCRCHPWNPGGYDPVPEVASLAEAGDAEQNRKETEREGETHFSASESSAGPLI